MPLREIITSLDADVTERALSRIHRTVTRRRQQDSDLADALLRILKSALGKELRDRIKEISTSA